LQKNKSGINDSLRGRSAADYLSDLDHSNIIRKVLAIAAFNALSAACWQSGAAKGYQLQTGVDAFDDVQIPQGGKSAERLIINKNQSSI
jgi:hypothetical protein